MEKPTAGEVRFDGRPAGPFAPEVRNRVTLLPQEPFLMKRTVLNNVAYGLRIRNARENVAERVEKALSYVGLDGTEFAHRPAYALSGGEAQRVALAARLVLKPDVLLLDEPTASIDALSAQLMKDAVLNARREWGTTLIVASHDWQWLYGICDAVFHLLKGRVSGDRPRQRALRAVGVDGGRALGKDASRTASRCGCRKPPDSDGGSGHRTGRHRPAHRVRWGLRPGR